MNASQTVQVTQHPQSTWQQVRAQVEADLHALDTMGLVHEDVAELSHYADRLHDVALRRGYEHSVEASATYPPPVPGGWFRINQPDATPRYTRTVHVARGRARELADQSCRAVLVDQWSPTELQDETNKGWSMLEVIEP